jgi:hypothetical protein
LSYPYASDATAGATSHKKTKSGRSAARITARTHRERDARLFQQVFDPAGLLAAFGNEVIATLALDEPNLDPSLGVRGSADRRQVQKLVGHGGFARAYRARRL